MTAGSWECIYSTAEVNFVATDIACILLSCMLNIASYMQHYKFHTYLSFLFSKMDLV